MKNPQETARRWLAQSEYNLTGSRVVLENSLWAMACFQAEQAAQMGLKAFLYFRGRRYVLIQSIHELIQECSKEDPDFLTLADYGGILDRYYLATRYPDVLPAPAIPFQSFTGQDAKQALEFATQIVDLVRAKVQSQQSGQ